MKFIPKLINDIITDMESIGRKEGEMAHIDDYEDYVDMSYFNLLERLPRELALRHLSNISFNNFNESQATEYLEKILQERTEAMTETEISDTHTQEVISGIEKEFLHELETSIFDRTDNFLGSGMTARIKRYDVHDKENNEVIPMAIKYLLTPTSKTLSVSAEHDMLLEVERIKQIEEIEHDIDFEYLSVPHPHFHHKTSKIQCYGMQLIDGPDLELGMSQADEGSVSPVLLENLKNVDLDKLLGEVDMFFTKMHTYCLHGDMKPKNLMVDEAGKFFIIDFGQSVLTNDIDDKSREQFENLKETEIEVTKEILKVFLKKVNKIIS